VVLGRVTTRRTFRAEIACGEFTDTVIAAIDHAYVKLDDVEGFTELAVIRRDRAGRVVEVWTADGAPLKLRQ